MNYRFLSMFSTNAVAKMIAAKADLPVPAVEKLFLLWDNKAAALQLPTVAGVIADGGVTNFGKEIFDRFLVNEELWPTFAELASSYIIENDPDGTFIPVLNNIASIPLKRFDRDFNGINEFILEGVFPFLKDQFGPPEIEHIEECCNAPSIVDIGGGELFCSNCGESL